MSAPTQFDALQAALSEAIYTLRDRPRIELHELVAAGLQHDAALFNAMDDDERRAVIELTMDDIPIAPGALGWLQIDFAAAGFRQKDEAPLQAIERVAGLHHEVEGAPRAVLQEFVRWAKWYLNAKLAGTNELARRLGVDLTLADFAPPGDGARKH